MSVIIDIEKQIGIEELDAFYNFDDACFMCGEQIMEPFIFWHGFGKGICLHLKCAGNLSLGLMRDAELLIDPENLEKINSDHKGRKRIVEAWPNIKL